MRSEAATRKFQRPMGHPEMTPYDRWLKFIARPTSESGLTFPRHQAEAIMAIPFREEDWRRSKRDLNKAVKALSSKGGKK